MKSIDPQFTVGDFLNGAKGAFDMVINAFNAHDRETLERLLAADVCESFEADINEQQEKGQKAITTLVALKSAELVHAEVKKTQATITVQFVSEQVHIVRDKDNKLVEGDPSRVEDIADEWTFERDLKSRDPNWTIVAT
jgi:predicted lipid-binding transport protein (Tim44 family)